MAGRYGAESARLAPSPAAAAGYPHSWPSGPHRRRAKVFDDPVDALRQGADVIGIDRGEHRYPQLVATEFAVRLGVDDAVRPQSLGDRRRVDVIGEVDGADHLGAQRGVGDERRGVRPLLGPGVQPLRGVRRALDRPIQAAIAQQPVELLGHQHQGADRGRVVGLVLEAVLDRDRQREEIGDPATGRGNGLNPGQRGRAHDRQPQASVAGEVFLRREVIGVGVADVDREAARARRRVDDNQRVTGIRRALDR